ncbi:hypothetical protein BD626DRAFT_481753 [Schizophyllum amplum]|uniref:Cyclin-dependent protein kinase inhibitor n=1 Tax=Schizophyllum amplum TaxID=97359 RepID=A0A550CUI4_9AGAR|nr:hypothetical protein BD626DRAFT_481753 [Auriculariopsis ampla]
MKFGKHIQAQQVPGWSQYYLDYKFLKKIISALADKRPASDAAALALGVRPSDTLDSSALSALTALGQAPQEPPLFTDVARDDDLQAHKAAFFFKLERELEKINLFYLQKEAELRLRLETLLSKRRAAVLRGVPDSPDDVAQKNVEWSAVEEGFRLLERDLGKLQQYIEINATGFRKILKKFDKRSKSSTKELYLARQVDIQPVFNRQLISELSDTVAACLLDLSDLSSGLKFEGGAANDIVALQIMTERNSGMGPFNDLESNLRRAVISHDTAAVADCVRYSDALASQPGGKPHVTRILWRVVNEAAKDLADLVLSSLSSPFDFQFVDDINGRTCLHEAAKSGCDRLAMMCIEHGVRVDKQDAYGRTALHYAAIHGNASTCKLLLEAQVPPDTLDLDNYSPLVYATLCGSVECVRLLLDVGHVSVNPMAGAGDLIPLSLACRSGHVDVVVLLLQRGALCLPNTNGEYPMHLAAREGRVGVCELLLDSEGWDAPDKYHEWTPLFHAATRGHDECVRVLLDAGARVNVVDELRHLPVHYAAWFGHERGMQLLLAAADASQGPATMAVDSPEKDALEDSEIDLIPSLSLPPPIMPHRVYGHNYLDRSHLVQVSLSESSGSRGPLGVRLHRRLLSPAFRDEYLLKSTPLKLVMTADPSVSRALFTLSLPQGADPAVFAFQIPSLDNLSLEFSIYPNFGTRTIGRAVALASMFRDASAFGRYVLPILDTRLHVIGEVAFELSVITAFDQATLAIGGDIETYWKSMSGPSISQPGLANMPHRSTLFGSAQMSPSAQSVVSASGQQVTVSSLQGEYVTAVVQLTRDMRPVVFAEDLLPESSFDVSPGDVTLQQFEGLARRLGREGAFADAVSPPACAQAIRNAMMSLSQLLRTLSPNIGLNLQLRLPVNLNAPRAPAHLDVNGFVDAVLRDIYDNTAIADVRVARRRLMFTSSSPEVTAALNWKQPNYPVFFSTQPVSASDNRPTLSIGEAVDFARSNNLLGIFADGNMLARVPSLMDAVRDAGLLLGSHSRQDEHLIDLVDAYMDEGLLVYAERTLVDEDM